MEPEPAKHCDLFFSSFIGKRNKLSLKASLLLLRQLALLFSLLITSNEEQMLYKASVNSGYKALTPLRFSKVLNPKSISPKQCCSNHQRLQALERL